MAVLKAPFPYFGGKSRVAGLIWERLGNPKNYIEPFFGSGAVLLARPASHFGHEARVETVNDLDGMLANFWRAVKMDPEAVATELDVMYSEVEYIARGRAMHRAEPELLPKLKDDPEFYDAKVAAYWVYGKCLGLGDNWECKPPTLGIYLGSGGRGVMKGDRNPEATRQWLKRIQERLRLVQVMCGDWSRICGDSPTIHAGTPVGVFLDPPYGDGDDVYGSGMKHVAAEAAEWAIERGNDSRFRIAYCGYEGTVTLPDSWECVPWKAAGGFSRVGKGGSNGNERRERIWFSPHCVKPGLFGDFF